MRLFNAGLAAPGTEAPSQGANGNTPPKRLLAHGQGTGQHRALASPRPWPWGRWPSNRLWTMWMSSAGQSPTKRSDTICVGRAGRDISPGCVSKSSGWPADGRQVPDGAWRRESSMRL